MSRDGYGIEGKRILITGGAGFIGSAVAERLVEKNTVVLFDCRLEGMPLNYTSIARHPNLRWRPPVPAARGSGVSGARE
jgi:nucleoside-diphosphate-sugar epimerase